MQKREQPCLGEQGQEKFRIMKNNKKNEELQSRREFFKKAAKATLPVIGAIVLASTPILGKAANTPRCTCGAGCHISCKGSCTTNCPGTCYRTCAGGCSGNSKYN